MKILITLSLIILISIANFSCDDSLGIEENVEKRLREKKEEDIKGYLPKYILGDTIVFHSYSVDENGEIIWGGTVSYGFMGTADTLVWNDKKCFYLKALCDQYPWCYEYHYTDGTKVYTNPNFPVNCRAWTADKYGMTFPPVQYVWILRADFKKDVKSWIGLDTFKLPPDYNMGSGLLFNGSSFIKGERGKDTTLITDQRKIKCLQIIETFEFHGNINRASISLPDTTIIFKFKVKTLYGENGFGFAGYDLTIPPYNFGLGYMNYVGWRCDLIGKKY